LTVRERWGLPPIKWKPTEMTKYGSHYHIKNELRIEIYKTIKNQIEKFRGTGNKLPVVASCKETHDVRKAVGLEHGYCNCQR